ERAVEQSRQPPLVESRPRYRRVGAHSQGFYDALARQIVAVFIRGEDSVEARIVEQRLLHRPGRGVANHLDRVTHQPDERRDATLVMNAAQSHRSPETDLRA